MIFQDNPYYEISADELADWLTRVAPDGEWSVDGDPVLTSLLDFPAPSEELALQLKGLNRAILVRAQEDNAAGQRITADDLDGLSSPTGVASAEVPSGRTLTLCWAGDTGEWVLYEDVD